MKITLDISPELKAAIDQNFSHMAHESANADLTRVIDTAKKLRAKSAVDEFEVLRDQHEQLEREVYNAKWRAEKLIKEIQPLQV